MNTYEAGWDTQSNGLGNTSSMENVAPSLIQNALRFLLIRYAQAPSLSLATVIVESLETLLAHPQFRPPWPERCGYRTLLMHWRWRCTYMK